MSGIADVLGNTEADDAFNQMEQTENEEAGKAAPEEEPPQEQPEEAVEAEEKPEPEAKEEAEPEVKEEPQKESESVPLATFLEQKNAAKEYRQTNEQLRQELSELKEMVQGLVPKEPEPNIDEDPYRYLDHKTDMTRQQIEDLQNTLKQTTEQQQAQQFTQRLQQMEDQFAQQTPDYWQAYEHLMKAELNEMQMMGVSQEEAQQAFAQKQAYVIQQAINQGRNPAQVAYDLAKVRGYTPPAPEQTEEEPQVEETKQAAPQQEPESLKKLARAQQNAQTLANRSGKTQKNDVDAEVVASLSDREFDKMFVGKDGDEEFRKIFEG